MTAEPTEDELRAYLEQHRDAYRTDARASFVHVFLSAERRGDSVAQDAARLLADLQAGTAGDDPAALGDPTMLERRFDDVPVRDIAAQFGDGFAAGIESAPVGTWHGPRPEQVDKVIFACAFGPIEQNLARNAAFRAGIPKEAPGFTINSTCGSSLQAIISAAQSISCGESDVVLAGGVESMSNAPYIMHTARWGQRLRHLEAYDLVWRGMQEPLIGVGMGLTAENIAERYRISRQEQDEFAVLSHQRAAKAIDDGKFKAEIAPFPIPRRKKAPVLFDTDEHVRREANLEMMAK